MNQKNEVSILLVEDDDVDYMVIKRSFASQRIANPLIRASDGIEALELLRNGTVKHPYIILLDLQMPRMGGLEFLDKIRHDPDLSGSVVFVLTTSKSEEDIAESYGRHIAGYFIKDATGQGFLDIVSLLEGYWRVVVLPGE
tara:strand:- start:116226 stop:116648 length:423 start_codon:yes stop_codon:yes gene_type:complete